ncbi:MAG: GNAT family N-acetyltransferase [Proteobacteria bacterium]|nr:GNAT family N-acetyltransferase [Pseudomonadota bacterium]
MSQSVEVQMLNALELFHYSYRFKNHLFIIALEEESELDELITDLRVILGARIQVLILCNEQGNLEALLATWSRRGYPFRFFKSEINTNLSKEHIDDLTLCFSTNTIPVFGVDFKFRSSSFSQQFDSYAIETANTLGADKLFLISSQPGLIIKNQLISHLTPEEVTPIIKDSKNTNIDAKRLELIIKNSADTGVETVLLQGKSGSLFQEIFTHRGAGTLFTSDYPNVIRKGEISDAMDLLLMMKPYVQSNIILSMSEDELAETIESYFVYSVNNSIVASARIIDFGESCELAKFCTMPRYQGRGRATQLAIEMINSIKKDGKKYVFALSIEPKMWEFFISLGFSKISRKKLALQWQKGYNFERPSKAFILTF